MGEEESERSMLSEKFMAKVKPELWITSRVIIVRIYFMQNIYNVMWIGNTYAMFMSPNVGPGKKYTNAYVICGKHAKS